ncbi:helix-turn-helix transcriptional regulator [Enterobacter wuhouensis]|uniref:AraC family transcriptional regulator n=1 Tax=Enterobacter wuhouensis TaxID=2529381 RepID=UPI002FD74ADC
MKDFAFSPELLSSPKCPALLAVISDTGLIRSTPHHSHPGGQLFGAVRGLLSVDLGNQRWVVPATHAVWIPPGMPHGLFSHGPFVGWSVWVSAACSKSLPDTAHVLPVSGLLREGVLRAASWNNSRPSKAQSCLAEVIFEEIRSTQPVPLGLPMPNEPRLQKIARALSDEPNDDRTMEEWAHWAGIPIRTLSRRYLVETGLNFTEWRQRVRLLKALELLAAGNSVKAVALDSGYENVSAFITLFRKTFGVTPGRYNSSINNES